MGRARRARRIAQTAAYGGGVGAAGLGALGALGYALLKAEALHARWAIGTQFPESPRDEGWYAAVGADRRRSPIELVVLGDSSAAGLGVRSRGETIGARLARGISAAARSRVHLTNVAVSGARSPDLDGQVERALDRVPAPRLAVISIGANDVTHRIDKAIAVRHLGGAVAALRAAGAEVIVATCPDLGTVQPVAQPLRLVARRLGRDLAAAQTVAVVAAGGRTVSVGDLLGPEFASRPREMFSSDRFHPSGLGYARVAAVLLPSALEALGIATSAAEHEHGHAVTLGPVLVERAARDARPGRRHRGRPGRLGTGWAAGPARQRMARCPVGPPRQPRDRRRRRPHPRRGGPGRRGACRLDISERHTGRTNERPPTEPALRSPTHGVRPDRLTGIRSTANPLAHRGARTTPGGLP